MTAWRWTHSVCNTYRRHVGGIGVLRVCCCSLTS